MPPTQALSAARGRRVNRLLRAVAQAVLKRALVRGAGYSYTRDWFTRCTKTWPRLLASFVGRPAVAALEIGSSEGRSAIWLLENVLTNPTSSITCIDPFYLPWREFRFDYNIRLSGRADQVVKRKGKSRDILQQLPANAYDLIYIDGSHVAADVLLDTLLSWARLKPGGVLIFDDYRLNRKQPAFMRPQLAIDLFLESFEGRYDLLHKEYQVLIRKLQTPA
jgi:hypothetical protein